MRLKDCFLVSEAQGVSDNHPHWLIPPGRIQEGLRQEVSKTIQSLPHYKFCWQLFYEIAAFSILAQCFLPVHYYETARDIAIDMHIIDR